MATQLKQTDFQPYTPQPRPNVRVAFSAGSATAAIGTALAMLPAATRAATLDDLCGEGRALHRQWLAERDDVLVRLEATEDGTPENEAAHKALNEIEARIFDTPAASFTDATAKLVLIAKLSAEGHGVPHKTARAALAEAETMFGALGSEGSVTPSNAESGATLAVVEISAAADALIATARQVLSPHMYKASCAGVWRRRGSCRMWTKTPSVTIVATSPIPP